MILEKCAAQIRHKPHKVAHFSKINAGGVGVALQLR